MRIFSFTLAGVICHSMMMMRKKKGKKSTSQYSSIFISLFRKFVWALKNWSMNSSNFKFQNITSLNFKANSSSFTWFLWWKSLPGKRVAEQWFSWNEKSNCKKYDDGRSSTADSSPTWVRFGLIWVSMESVTESDVAQILRRTPQEKFAPCGWLWWMLVEHTVRHTFHFHGLFQSDGLKQDAIRNFELETLPDLIGLT